MPRPLPLLVLLSAAAAALSLAGCAGSAKQPLTASSPPPSLLTQHGAPGVPVANEQVAVLESAPAPRARRLTNLNFTGLVGGAAPATPQVAQVVPTAVAADKEKLVVEAWIQLQADDVAQAAAAVVARVEADGGRVVSSNLVGAERAASSAALELRVPPDKVAAFTGWLPSLGVIESKRTLASDVGKVMFDQALALQNLELTMSRLQKLAEKDVPIKELLEIEQEMTRVRGEIERVKGEQRWLADRVELATVTLTIAREGGPVDPTPSARVFPGPRLALLSLFDPEGRPRTRVGGGVTLHVHRYFTLDLDVFPAKGGDSRAVIATAGSALYSSFLGNGRRRYGNPYLGARVGYGHLSGEASAVIEGELGVELFRHRYLLVEVAGRAIAFFRDGNTDTAFHGLFGAAVPF